MGGNNYKTILKICIWQQNSTIYIYSLSIVKLQHARFALNQEVFWEFQMEFHSNTVWCKIFKFLYLQIDFYFYINLLDKIPHKFSFGFKSEDWVGQSKTSILFVLNQSFVSWEVCMAALSCWLDCPSRKKSTFGYICNLWWMTWTFSGATQFKVL